MEKPSKELVDAFFEWFRNDHHSQNEDIYKSIITKEHLASLSPNEFIELFFQFARDGGKLQSGGYRTAPMFKASIEADYEEFKKYALEPFKTDFNELDWLGRIKLFKGFGQGIATIYLNRIDKTRFVILNNKSADAMKLFKVKLSSDLIERYKSVKDAQRQLIEWFPEFENYYRADAINHFLVGTEDGASWKKILENEVGGPDIQTIAKKDKADEPRYWIYAPGDGARFWDQYYHENVMGIGWDKVKNDLSMYKSKQDLKEKYFECYGDDGSDADFGMLYDFLMTVKVGDYIFAKKGIKELVGYGKVTSDYFYDEKRPEYKHLRKADWLKAGRWQIPEGATNLPRKTLTELDDKDRIRQYLQMIEIDKPDPETQIETFFTEKTFELLTKLHDHPTAEFYSEHSSEFRNFVEEPVRRLLQATANKLPKTVLNLMETEKGVVSRIIKNDYGKGGAWDFFWGAFYPKGGRRIEDPQLFVVLDRETLRLGFSVGERSKISRTRFVKNCRDNVEILFDILEPNLSDEALAFGTDKSRYKSDQILLQKKVPTWREWLKDPDSFGIHVDTSLSTSQLLSISKEALTDRAARVFQQLFPLILLAYHDEPLGEINQYLDIAQPVSVDINPAYTLEEFASETNFDLEEINKWVRAIERKKQAIFYGPPGTGKTFVAEKLAKHLIGGGDGFQDIIQFHPSYAYEDFLQGLRPKAVTGGSLEYVMTPGRFKDFCNRASACNGVCVLIIDEINRANLSRVLGELMYLLEYRNESIPMAGGERFQIPENVRIIGTMNTADRSIALVDHALRRRFAFLGLYPNYEVLNRYHSLTGFDPSGLINVLDRLNATIGDKHYSVGISFFMQPDIQAKLQDIWQMDIEPYIEELFFDQLEKAGSFSWNRVRDEINKS